MEKTLRSDICKNFISDGKCKEYNLNFAFFDYENIEVYLNDILQTSGFEVEIDPDEEGGSVVFNEAPPSETMVTVIRKLPIKRTTDFKESGPFRASKVNMEFDYQLACIEQLEEKMTRTVCKPPYILENIDLSMPYPEAGKAVVWNKAGNALKNSDMSMEELAEAVKNSEDLYERSLAGLNLLEEYSERAYESCVQADESASKVEEVFAAKADTNLNNIDGNIDYVVESWTSNDRTNWYRIYKSGWVEQGGILRNRDNYISNLNFLVPFSNTDYLLIPNSSLTNTDTATVTVVNETASYPRTKTGVYLIVKSANYNGGYGSKEDINWYACGFKEI